jgi:tetratricopeptide (TPR) repeat protein
MIKIWLMSLVLCITIIPSFAQRNLEVREKTEGISVFTEKDPEVINAGGAQAGAIISCPLTLNLSFSSNVDRTVDVWKTEERGELRFYYLRFIVGRYRGANYDNRTLEITASGFLPYRLALRLQPSESKSFEVFDPNATVGVGCFYQHYNEGVELYRKALYIEAKEKYRTALECTDVPADVSVNERIAFIDSILLWRHRADSCFDLVNYKNAINLYQKIVAQNREDEYANRRYNESLDKHSDLCSRYFISAEDYFENGSFQEAKQLFTVISDQQCSQASKADARLIEIRKYEREGQERRNVIVYEYAKNTPFGFSIGNYRPRKVRGYLSFRTNADFFKSIQMDNYDAVRSELNASLGLTFGIYHPVWLFMGGGYTEVGRWEKEDDYDITRHRAISPEIGILGKLGPVVLRYTFQYRHALMREYQDVIWKNSHVFGLGVCF